MPTLPILCISKNSKVSASQPAQIHRLHSIGTAMAFKAKFEYFLKKYTTSTSGKVVNFDFENQGNSPQFN